MPTPKKKSASTDSSITLKEVQNEIFLARKLYRKKNQVRYVLSLAFLRGVFSAVGAMIAVAIVIPMIVFALRSIQWPEIISGFISTIVSQMEQTSPRESQATADQ